MGKVKSIDKLFIFFILTDLLIIFLTSLILHLEGIRDYNKYFYFLIFIFNLSLPIFLVKRIAFLIYIKSIFLSLFLYLFLGLIFRDIRKIFPISNNLNSDAIGFSGYFGYPMYFDGFIFIILVIIPLVVYYFFDRSYD